MTGLTPPEFSALLPPFEHAVLASMEDHTIDGHPRTSRRYRTYETSPVPTMADKWLFMLTSLKQHPIQEVQGQLCGMSQANANTWMHLLHPIWNRVLAHQDWLPARTADELATRLATTQTQEGLTSPLSGMMVLSDRSIARASPRSSKSIPAGKKQCHTIKNLLIIDETCHVCFLSDTYAGQAHDKSLADLVGDTLPDGSGLYQDRGFQGVVLAEVTIVQPKKNPRGGELTPPEKATTRGSSSIRIRVEHGMGGRNAIGWCKTTSASARMGFVIRSWKRVVACITFAYSTGLGAMLPNKY